MRKEKTTEQEANLISDSFMALKNAKQYMRIDALDALKDITLEETREYYFKSAMHYFDAIFIYNSVLNIVSNNHNGRLTGFDITNEVLILE